jgi:hypothetical protein
LRSCEDVLAFNQERPAHVDNFEVWPSVLNDLADAARAQHVSKMQFQMMLGDAAAHSGLKPKCA